MRSLPTQHQFLLLLNGPLCGGKSTLIKYMSDTYAGLFVASTDAIKWQISDFTPETYKRTISEMIVEATEVALKDNLSVVGEGLGLMSYPDLRDRYYELGEKYDARVLEANIEAPYESLRERFFERVDKGAENGEKLAVTTEEEMKKRYDFYIEHKNPELPTYDTQEARPEDIARDLLSHL